MIDSAKDYAISSILKADSNVRYEIPKYQRKYTWSKDNWESLFDDIFFNGKGHFLGSIICINTTRDTGADEVSLDLVDGQQRLTSLSLLYAAIHRWILDRKDSLDEDEQDDLRDVKRRLVLRGSNSIRVSPSYHGNNHDDYLAALCACGAMEGFERPNFAGNRKMFKAYRYFLSRLEELNENEEPVHTKAAIFALLNRLNNAIVVKIEVSSHADAYILFESLNNRGVPLSAIDLIKNKLLSVLDQNGVGTLEGNFEKWNSFLNNLTEHYAVQERFLRQFYNAFKHRKEIAVDKAPIATRSKIILIYQALIDRDASKIFSELQNCSRLYSRLMQPEHEDNPADLTRALQQLERIGGTPGYTFLMYLLSIGISTSDLVKVIQLLVCFFVKRNVTDQPPTRDLDRMFMELVDVCSEGFDLDTVGRFIRTRSADEERFKQDLQGDMYENNVGATRFILCALEESQQTRETYTDLWARDDKQKFIWTIEHIFPQGKNIPDEWVEMIAGGDRELANQHREDFVHKLGNLTITGFNNQLSNMAFDKKRDRRDRRGKTMGYKNGLVINKELAASNSWSVEDIEARTVKVVGQTLALFDYDRVEQESI